MQPTLLERIANGERSAVPECIKRYGPLVWALSRRYSKNLADAEDAVQEIFIDLWQSASRYNPALNSEPNYVAMIARRRLLDRIRKMTRTVPTQTLPDLDITPDESTHDHLEIAEHANLIRIRMHELSPIQRKVLEHAIDYGMSQSEIATELGLPIGTVKAHARRGLLKLREMVESSALDTAESGVQP